ncbi:MAG: hypothetical protein ACP5D7_05725 [Limnospira sp.]
MKCLKSALASLLVPATLLFSGGMAGAQTVEPERLTISGNRATVQTRQLYIKTDTPIEELQVIPFDVNGTDGVSVFPGSAIAPGELQPILGKPEEAIVPVEFNFRKAPDSGEFVGTLRLSYAGGQLAVPVTLRVKDHWFFPLLMLVAGTGLGIAVSVYRSQGRPRDEILIRVGQLRVQMEEDPDLEKAAAFASRIQAFLIEVKMELQDENWEEAKKIIDSAEAIWRRWVMGRLDWLAQFEYSDRLKEKLNEYDANSTFVRTMNWDLQEVLSSAPELESPALLREKLEAIAQQINSYVPLKEEVKQLQKLIPPIPDDEEKPLAEIIRELDRHIDASTPLEIATDTIISEELQKLKLKVGELNPSQWEWVSSLPLISPPPVTRSDSSWNQQAQGANVRLKSFIWTSYAVAVVLLAGAGFSELYVDNTTFGSNPWKDYFALMAWGFGAEATRDAIAKVVQSWGLPGLNP